MNRLIGLLALLWLNFSPLWAQKDRDSLRVPLFTEEQLANQPIYTNLPQAYRVYHKVYRLSLKGTGGYYGKITGLPYDIDSLLNLQSLSVINESLDNLPWAIGKLPSLQQLYLSGNKFTAIPDTVFCLKNLKRLDLRANQLTHISERIGELTELEFLYFNDNPQLNFIPTEALGKLKKLKYLNLKHTKIPREQAQKVQKLLPHTKVEFF
ncbi:MAG: leucine-rich repeat domain-containing protein [Microscillaceae bacterium]|jgi:Leucine-rich repeat (LRR) protein|nr:leucine-rich repeat domain-containing protein [Microscillaceae bacterium]